MSSRVRFIDLVRPIMPLLPEVEKPMKNVRTLPSYKTATVQRQTDLDCNHSIYLPDLLLDPHLRHDQARRSRSSLLAQSHSCLQQGYPHGTRYLPHNHLWNDHATPCRSQDHRSQPVKQRRQRPFPRSSKT